MDHLQFEGVDIVKLLVGPDQVVFLVHHDILCEVSPFFKAAFEGEFAEGLEKSMKLPEDETEDIQKMIAWIYARRLETWRPLDKDSKDFDAKLASSAHWWYLARLYCLSDKFNIIKLKNAIYDEIYDLSKLEFQQGIVPMQIDVINYVYTNSTSVSSFRKVILVWYVNKLNFDWYERPDTVGSISQNVDFAAELAVAFALKLKGKFKNVLDGPKSDLHCK